MPSTKLVIFIGSAWEQTVHNEISLRQQCDTSRVLLNVVFTVGSFYKTAHADFEEYEVIAGLNHFMCLWCVLRNG